jgi:hypothetical protein
MNKCTYFAGRAQHYFTLASEARDPAQREALEAAAREFLVRAARSDPAKEIAVVDGVAPEIGGEEIGSVHAQ